MGLVRAVLICAVLGLTTGKAHGSGSSVSLVKAVGDTVVFNTARDPAPYTELSWIFRNNATIITVSDGDTSTDPGYENRTTLLADGSLELRNLTVNDWGNYTVNITSTGAPEFISVFSLRVLEPVSNVSFTASATDLIEGDPVKLACSATSNSMIIRIFSVRSSRLSATYSLSWNVTRSDTGPWACEAFNDISRVVTEEINLTISYGPDMTLTTVPSQDTYDEGSYVTLTCRVISKPEAEITWTHNETLLPFNGTELVLQDIKSSQSGRYTCTAYNPKTNIRRSLYRDISIAVEPDIKDPKGLSVGAQVGIALACIAVAGGGAGGFAYWYFKKR